jgi:hypothetical protein
VLSAAHSSSQHGRYRPCLTRVSAARKLSKGQKQRKRKKARSERLELEGSEQEPDSGSDDDPPKSRKATVSPRKTSTNSQEEVEIGRDAARLTYRHKQCGDVSKVASKNTFITVGSYTAKIEALEKVYGKGLCHAALCSFGRGDLRMLVCDCASDAMHRSVKSRAHRLPSMSGPNDKANWAKVTRLSKKRAAGN